MWKYMDMSVWGSARIYPCGCHSQNARTEGAAKMWQCALIANLSVFLYNGIGNCYGAL